MCMWKWGLGANISVGKWVLAPKGEKVALYSIRTFGGSDPDLCQAAGDSRKTGGRLPLLSARPTVTFSAAEHYCRLASTELHCSVTEAHVCEQLVQCPA